MTTTLRRATAPLALTALVAALLAAGPPAADAQDPARLTNLDHVDFLRDDVAPPPQAGHTTWMLEDEPELGVLWTYADARDGGTFERVGGGPYDPATDTWGQGAFNADDVTRAAVVYLRDHEQTGDADSLAQARQLLRGVTYLQTTTGPDAGNVVLWMQPDGTLNPSAEPVELPDPSDSADSYWLARTIWALGEGYATFVDEDPAFAGFLAERMELALDAVERERLDPLYGTTQVVDGLDWPAWLIADGADASSEAVYGLTAYVEAGGSERAEVVLGQLAEGIAMLQLGDVDRWPYRAIMPFAQARTIWHAWGDQMSGALATASDLAGDDLLTTARREVGSFTPHLLVQGGPDIGWLPSPTDTTQIAYGADATLQNALAVADATGEGGFDALAAVAGAWYFGNNRAGEWMYEPATGVTYDGLQADGSINRNSGAESAIHGQLSMLALDAHPEVAAWAMVADRTDQVSWQLIEGEDATGTTGDAEVVTPAEAWTGESLWGGGAYLALDGRATARIPFTAPTRDRYLLQLVAERTQGPGARTRIGVDRRTAGVRWWGGAGDAGVTPTDGYVDVRGRLSPRIGAGPHELSVAQLDPRRELALDGALVQPALEWLHLAGHAGEQVLLRSFDTRPRRQRVLLDGDGPATAVAYDALGTPVWRSSGRGGGGPSGAGDGLVVRVVPGGFTVVRAG